MNPYAERPNPHWPTAAEIRKQIDEAETQLQALYLRREITGQNCDDPAPSARLLELRIQGLYATLGEIEPSTVVAGPHADFAPLSAIEREKPLSRAAWGLLTLQVALTVAACVLVVMQCTGTL